jgi:hypothetical protein
MKMKFVTIAALCGGILMTPALRAADSKPAAARKPAASVELPKQAVLVSPGTYTYTDAQGKKWIYRQTPFGLAKFEDREPPASDQENEQKRIAQTRAYEEGDSVRFERPGPFGLYKWKVKKTELNSMEKAVWERTRDQQPREKE